MGPLCEIGVEGSGRELVVRKIFRMLLHGSGGWTRQTERHNGVAIMKHTAGVVSTYLMPVCDEMNRLYPSPIKGPFDSIGAVHCLFKNTYVYAEKWIHYIERKDLFQFARTDFDDDFSGVYEPHGRGEI